jgi:SAM-dependent methyltransferase
MNLPAGGDIRALLVCPRDRSALRWSADIEAGCDLGHRYPVVHGVPILIGDTDPTGFASETLRRIEEGRYASEEPIVPPGVVDPVVQDAIVRTNGNLYRHLAGRLPRYPIPEIRLPAGRHGVLLDVGGGWGRWSVAAARAGYRPVLVDPQLELVLAATRVARQLDVELTAICGDATALPFADDAFDIAFAYSVLQHFAKSAARAALGEMRRVVRDGGTVLVQLANRWGPRQLMRQLSELARPNASPFRVRLWTVGEMEAVAADAIGSGETEVDGFLSLNVQPADLDLMPTRYRSLIRASEQLRLWSERLPVLRYVADSLYVRAVVGEGPPSGTCGAGLPR